MEAGVDLDDSTLLVSPTQKCQSIRSFVNNVSLSVRALRPGILNESGLTLLGEKINRQRNFLNVESLLHANT